MAAKDKAMRLLLELEMKAEQGSRKKLGKTQPALTTQEEGAIVRSPKNHRRKVRMFEN